MNPSLVEKLHALMEEDRAHPTPLPEALLMERRQERLKAWEEGDFRPSWKQRIRSILPPWMVPLMRKVLHRLRGR